MEILNFAKPVSGNFLVDIILWLVTSTSSVAVGIILFTLILKLITLPFDFASRASMRKNALKMEEMRPELEKLQKQYAGDKNLYNQKMMALYKRNGYSMFGACLPTILTLVIFIVAINGFTAYSQFQNRQYFYDMTLEYNEVIYSGFEEDGEYIYRDENGKLCFDNQKIVEQPTENENLIINIDEQAKFYEISTKNGYIQRKFYYSNGYDNASSVEYIVLEQGVLANTNLLNYEGKTFKQAKELNADLTATDFLIDVCQTMAAKQFEKSNDSFLWVKNIWVTDSPMKHPVESDWKAFVVSYAYPEADSNHTFGEPQYKILTAKLENYKTAPNGYFILVLLTAASSLLMQIVMSKTQKSQMELQTVDGQGVQTQKFMMWLMPIMMAVFAFMYTAAFSIYIILSSVISLGTTFLINFVVDRKFKKQQPKEQIIRGRVYVPKEQPKEEKPKKVKVDKNKPMENDFLAGTADKKKHPRGRIK